MSFKFVILFLLTLWMGLLNTTAHSSTDQRRSPDFHSTDRIR